MSINQVEALNLLRRYVEAREGETAFGKTKEGYGAQIKEYLAESDGEILWDGEHKLEAFLQERRLSERYDVAAMPQAVVLALWKANCLNVDTKVLAALEGKSAIALKAKPYRVPAGVTTALVVRRRE